MPRSAVIKVKDIYARRASNWEWHYKNRDLAKMYAPADGERVALLLAREVPPPVLLVDGSILDGIENLRATARALEYFNLTQMNRFMMCVWYWSESCWMDFVRAFQALPDVIEDHYLFYDEGLDAVRLMPLSTKGQNREYVHEGEVGGKWGGSMAVPPRKRAKVRFVG